MTIEKGMEIINNTIIFLKQKGVRDTFYILTQCENYKAELKAFYKELRNFSYYNSFYRVKDALIKKGLIALRTYNRKKFISLTETGIKIYEKLIELDELIRR